jgi:hypothetical protein
LSRLRTRRAAADCGRGADDRHGGQGAQGSAPTGEFMVHGSVSIFWPRRQLPRSRYLRVPITGRRSRSILTTPFDPRSARRADIRA